MKITASNKSAIARRLTVWHQAKSLGLVLALNPLVIRQANSIESVRDTNVNELNTERHLKHAAQLATELLEGEKSNIDDSANFARVSRLEVEAESLPQGHGWSGWGSYLLSRAERMQLARECPKRATQTAARGESDPDALPAGFVAPSVPDYEPLISVESENYAQAVIRFELDVANAPLMLMA